MSGRCWEPRMEYPGCPSWLQFVCCRNGETSSGAGKRHSPGCRQGGGATHRAGQNVETFTCPLLNMSFHHMHGANLQGEGNLSKLFSFPCLKICIKKFRRQRMHLVAGMFPNQILSSCNVFIGWDFALAVKPWSEEQHVPASTTEK